MPICTLTAALAGMLVPPSVKVVAATSNAVCKVRCTVIIFVSSVFFCSRRKLRSITSGARACLNLSLGHYFPAGRAYLCDSVHKRQGEGGNTRDAGEVGVWLLAPYIGARQ